MAVYHSLINKVIRLIFIFYSFYKVKGKNKVFIYDIKTLFFNLLTIVEMGINVKSTLF